MKRAGPIMLAVLVAAAAISAPFLLSELNIRLTNLGLISAIAVLGLTFAFGYAGFIHLGQAAFMGLGAYCSTILAVKLGLDVWVSLPIGIAFSGFCSFLVAVPMLRLRGHYLALATVGLNVSLEIVEKSWTKLTNGFDGISGIPGFHLFGRKLDGDREIYWLILAFLLLACLIAWLVRHSHLGRAMVALRDDEIATLTAGANVVRLKVLAFTLSGLYGGLAGGLYAHYAAYISPSDFALIKSIEFLAMLIVGGEASIFGAVLGTLVLNYLPEWLRFLGKESYPAYFGLFMLAVLIFMPKGLVGLARRLHLT